MKLSRTQVVTLGRAARTPLRRDRAGWGQLHPYHGADPLWRASSGTIYALERRGLVAVQHDVARITETGRKALVGALNAEIHIFPDATSRRAP